MSTLHQPDVYERALRHERAGYIANGNTEGLRAVDAELARLGVVIEDATAVSDVEQAVARKGRPRKPAAES